MSDKENRFFSTENQGEGAATDQPEVEGHRLGTYPASENPDERVAFATDQPEVEGHRLHATEDGSDDERAFSRSH